MKELLAEGHIPICYETASDIGGVFSKDEYSRRTADSTYLTISNYYMAFSDSVLPERKFWHATEYNKYLHQYCEEHRLRERIQFRHKVRRVQKCDIKWTVEIENLSTKEVFVREFDAVAVCSGSHQQPRFPEIKGMDTFTGKALHAAEYRNADQFRGQRVVVVGLGESSADIVSDIAVVAKECHLATRSLPFVIPRVRKGHAADAFTNALTYRGDNAGMFSWLVLLLFGLVFIPVAILLYPVRKLTLWFSSQKAATDPFGQSWNPKMADWNTLHSRDLISLHRKWIINSESSNISKFATKNCRFIPYILDGRIKHHEGSIREITGSIVRFSDGQSVEIDSIVYATGYRDVFPFLEGLQVPENNVRNLFKHAFLPAAGPTLAFLGFVRPTTGGIPLCSEMNARYWALLLSKKRFLPENIEQRIREDKEREMNEHYQSPNLNTVVNPVEFLESMAKLIGCEVPYSSYVFRPAVFVRLLCATSIGARYRLRGPHANPKNALKMIKKLDIPYGPVRIIVFTLAKIFYRVGLGSGDMLRDYFRVARAFRAKSGNDTAAPA